MKYVFYLSFLIICAISLLLFIYFDTTKPFIDLYANHATIIGLLLGVFAFVVTAQAFFEAIKANTKAQVALKQAVLAYEAKLNQSLAKIRLHHLKDACQEAYHQIDQAGHSFRAGLIPMTIIRIEEARKQIIRVLNHSHLDEADRIALRSLVSELQITMNSIENRTSKSRTHLNSVILDPMTRIKDTLDLITSRLNRDIMENPTDE